MTEMVDAVDGMFKIIISDVHALEILNSVVKMHDLTEHGVPLVENIDNKRQPVPQSQAIYFITPTKANVDKVINDWAIKDPYSEAHVFFTSTAPGPVVQAFAGTRVATKIKSLKDMLLDFVAPETLLFSLQMKYDIQSFFGPMANPAKGQQAAAQLAAVLQTLRDTSPLIRYQDTPAAKAVALRVQDIMDAAGATLAKAGGAGPAEGKVTLLVVDRTIDLNTVLLHDLNYQAMLQDLMPLANGVYEQQYKDGAGKDAVRRVPIDENDPSWYKYRLEHIANLMKTLPADLQALHDANPQLAQASMKRGGTTLSELGEAVRMLPAFQEKQAKLSLHIDIVSKLFNSFKVQSLRDVIDLEQCIITGETPEGTKAEFKMLYEQITNIGKNPNVPKVCKERLILLLVINEGANLSQEKREKLLHAMGLGADQNSAIEALKFFNVNIEKDKKKASVKPKKGAAASDDAAMDLSRYVPKVSALLEAAVGETLSTTEFPYVRAPTGGNGGASAPAAAAGVKSLRAAAPRFATALGKTSASASDKVLALPHNNNIPVSSSNRLVVFFVGGVTMSEVRIVYKQVETLKQEILVGGTSIASATDFLSQLNMLAMS